MNLAPVLDKHNRRQNQIAELIRIPCPWFPA